MSGQYNEVVKRLSGQYNEVVKRLSGQNNEKVLFKLGGCHIIIKMLYMFP